MAAVQVVRGSTHVHVRRILAAAGAVCLLVPMASSAQSITEVPEKSSCSACRIELRPATTLGRSTDPVGFGFVSSIAVNSRGEYLVSSTTSPGQIALYDSTGRYVRLIGRQGGGPGEFRGELLLRFDPEDSLHILERKGIRYTVLDPRLRYARSANVGVPPLEFSLGPGGLLFTSTYPVPVLPDSQNMLAVLSAGGATRAEFGRMAASTNPDGPLTRAEIWWVTVGPRGGLWSGQPGSGLIVDRWDRAGHLVRLYRGGPGWLRKNRLPRKRTYPGRTPPPAQLVALDFTDGQHLWVFTETADAHWKPIPKGQRYVDPNRIFDTMVDVIDVSTGKLLVDQRFDPILLPVGEHGLVYAREPVPSGDEVIRIWKAVLMGWNPHRLQR